MTIKQNQMNRTLLRLHQRYTIGRDSLNKMNKEINTNA